MTSHRIAPESGEYRELLHALSKRSDVACMVSVAESEMAERLARETGHELYRIDLSAIISKYIGEKENTLNDLSDEVPAGVALILVVSEVSVNSGRAGPLIQTLAECAGLIIFVTDDPERLSPVLPTPLLAHLEAAGDG